MQNILVTGGAGFVGTNLVDHLLTTDQLPKITIFDALGLPHFGNQNLQYLSEKHRGRVRFEHGDITNKDRVDEVFAGNTFDTVVHLAAIGSNWRALQDPVRAYEINVVGTQNIFQGAQQAGVETFYNQSTIEVYGNYQSDTGPFSVDSELNPTTPYSDSKAIAEKYVRDQSVEAGSMRTAIGRISNIYGRRQHPDAFISSFIRRALLNIPLEVSGDGSQTRQLLHVDDYSRAVELILRDGSISGILNIGNSERASVLSVAEDILSFVGKEASGNIVLAPPRPMDDHDYFLIPSPELAASGWRPTIPLDEGLRSTFVWYRDNKSLDDLTREDFEVSEVRRNTEARDIPTLGQMRMDYAQGRRK